MEQRMSVLTLGVSDLKQSRLFYERLGWCVATEEQADHIVAFNFQSFVLALYPIDALADDVGIEMHRSTHASFTLAYNVASQQEVDLVIERARAMGVNIIKEPQKVFWGGYSSYFSDPDGYLWEVAYNPFSIPEKDGAFQWE